MPAKSSLRAAIYLRISLDALGDGLAIDRQREDCERIVKERGWILTDIYEDRSKSAFSRKVHRPGYERLVEDYRAGRFDALVAWDLDRLTRDPRQLEDWIDAAEQRGLQIVTANGEADLGTDSGRLYARVKGAVARNESEHKATRQKRAAQQRANLGRAPKGTRLSGYNTDGSVIPSEAKVIKAVFAKFLAGEPLYSIAKWLTASNVPTRRGGPWVPSSVRSILTNPRYAGLSTYAPNPAENQRRERLIVGKGTWEAIVSEDDFALVQTRLSDPRRVTNREGTARKHLGSGLYICDVCDVKVTSWTGDRYCCRTCGLTRARPMIDKAVEVVVRERLADPRLAAAIAPASSEALEALRAEATGLRARIERIAADYDDGTIDGARFRAATEKAEAALEANLAKQAEHTGSAALSRVVTAKDPVVIFDEGTLDLRRSLVEALVEVRLKRARRGSKVWDPSTVVISPRSRKA